MFYNRSERVFENEFCYSNLSQVITAVHYYLPICLEKKDSSRHLVLDDTFWLTIQLKIHDLSKRLKTFQIGREGPNNLEASFSH